MFQSQQIKPLTLIFVLSALSLWTCKSNQNNGNNGEQCKYEATVKDFSGLDGCGLLIVTSDGRKLSPINMDQQDVQLAAGQNIRFNFKEAEAQMSICMTEDAFIEITCLEILTGDIPNIKDCLKLDSPEDAKWLKDAVSKLEPVSIYRHTYRSDGWAYLFDTIEGGYLYDCQGNLVCENKTWAECKEMTEPGSEGVLIYKSR